MEINGYFRRASHTVGRSATHRDTPPASGTRSCPLRLVTHMAGSCYQSDGPHRPHAPTPRSRARRPQPQPLITAAEFDHHRARSTNLPHPGTGWGESRARGYDKKLAVSTGGKSLDWGRDRFAASHRDRLA